MDITWKTLKKTNINWKKLEKTQKTLKKNTIWGFFQRFFLKNPKKPNPPGFLKKKHIFAHPASSSRSSLASTQGRRDAPLSFKGSNF